MALIGLAWRDDGLANGGWGAEDRCVGAPKGDGMQDESKGKGVGEAAPQAAGQPRDPTRDKAVAYILWIFLGFVGAHRFWWGKWQTGLGMLLLPIAGLGMMEAVAEALASGGVAIAGWLMIVGSLLWTLLDAALIALWDPRH